MLKICCYCKKEIKEHDKFTKVIGKPKSKGKKWPDRLYHNRCYYKKKKVYLRKQWNVKHPLGGFR